MPEIGVPQRLDTFGGTTILSFNVTDDDGILLVQRLPGFAAPKVRGDMDDRPAAPGAIVHRSELAARMWTIEGLLIHSADEGSRVRLTDDLVGACHRWLLNEEGRYVFRPSGSPDDGSEDRFLRVRLQPEQAVDVAEVDAASKSFGIPLIAPEPTIYTLPEIVDPDTLQHPLIYVGDPTYTITNAGNAPSWPVFRVWGPWTQFEILNLTTGDATVFSGAGVSNGHYVEIVSFWETAYLDGNSADQLSQVTLDDGGVGFPLAPGPNEIDFTGLAGSGSNTHLEIVANNAWY